MDNMDSDRRKRIIKNRRKERAEKVEKERGANDNDDDNVGPPVKKPRKKPKPVAEEDIIEGFSILAFKRFEDIARAINLTGEDSDNKKLCVQVLKRSQGEQGDNNKGTEKEKKKKKPKSNSTLSKQQFKENGEIMVDKVAGVDVKSPSTPSSGGGNSPYPHPKKLARMNGPSSKDPQHNNISDGRPDLFAPPRKDSSPKLPDNLHSSIESKGVDIQRHQPSSNCEKKTPSSSPPSATVVNNNSISTAVDVKLPPPPRIESLDASIPIKPSSQTNGQLSQSSSSSSCSSSSSSALVGTEDINGHIEVDRTSQGVVTQHPHPHQHQLQNHQPQQHQENKLSFHQQKPKPAPQTSTLFTPYAATAITRVSTPIAPPVSSQSQSQSSSIPENSSSSSSISISNSHDQRQSPHPTHSHSHRVNRNNHISTASSSGSSSINSNFNASALSSGDLAARTSSSAATGSSSSPGSHIQRSTSPSPVVQKTGPSKPSKSSSPGNQTFNRSGKVTPTTSKSAAFGSIARLLDSPTTSRKSPTANVTATSTNYNSFHHQPFGGAGGVTNGSINHHHHHQQQQQQQNSGPNSIAVNNCSSRSHSPRGHSPSRERDSYSSNVSSLSRSSVTPVSGSSQLPPNLSPLQNLQSYTGKTASWLSTVPGLSPVPRPTPPPLPSHSSSSTSGSSGPGGGSIISSSGAPLSSGGASGQLSISAGTTPNSVFPGLVPGASHSLPPHSSSAMFAPPILSISQHPSAHPSPFGPADALFHGSSTSNELVRRDLESRFLSSERNAAQSQLFRPGDLHPHHHLLPPLPPQPSPGQPPPPHSALFPPPLFKDLSKVGLDSSFYRTNLAMSYPGFNGMLPPNLNLQTTPFAPPNQIAAFTPKITDPCKPAKVMKTGRWNAMHVRIAWEIYHDQQKGVGGDNKNRNNNSSSPATKSSILATQANSNSSSSNNNSNSNNNNNHLNHPAPPASAPPPSNNNSNSGNNNLASELLRQQQQQQQPPPHVFGLSNRPEHSHGPPTIPFSASALLSPHHHPGIPSHRQFDSMFLNSAPHLGPPLTRYPAQFGLGPASAYTSLLNRDLSNSLAAQEQWHRSHRGPFPPLAAGWPLPDGRSSTTSSSSNSRPPEREGERNREAVVKTPTESRRHHKEDRTDKRLKESSSRNHSPFRDRSPARTPNGDTDSRSSHSRSSDSHSIIHGTTNKGRMKEETVTNGELDRLRSSTPLMTERDKLLHQMSSDSKHQSLMNHHQARLFPGSPLTNPITSSWEHSFGMMGSGPRMSSAESFRLSLLQLSERERELSRGIPHPHLRPPLFNGPFSPMSLGPNPLLHHTTKNSPSLNGTKHEENPQSHSR